MSVDLSRTTSTGLLPVKKALALKHLQHILVLEVLRLSLRLKLVCLPAISRDILTILHQLVAKRTLCPLVLKLQNDKLRSLLLPPRAETVHNNVNQIQTPGLLFIDVLAQQTRYSVKMTHSIRLKLRFGERSCFRLHLIHWLTRTVVNASFCGAC